MSFLTKVVGGLAPGLMLKTARRSRSGPARFAPVAEPMESRAMLSFINFIAVPVVPPRPVNTPSIQPSAQVSSFGGTCQPSETGVLNHSARSCIAHDVASPLLPGGPELAKALATDAEPCGKVEVKGQTDL